MNCICNQDGYALKLASSDRWRWDNRTIEQNYCGMSLFSLVMRVNKRRREFTGCVTAHLPQESSHGSANIGIYSGEVATSIRPSLGLLNLWVHLAVEHNVG